MPTILQLNTSLFGDSGQSSRLAAGFAGALAIYFVLPELGKVYDNAKLEAAGGELALATLKPRSADLQQVLAFAAEKSFQMIAVVPALLFFIFGAVWLVERRKNEDFPHSYVKGVEAGMWWAIEPIAFFRCFCCRSDRPRACNGDSRAPPCPTSFAPLRAITLLIRPCRRPPRT